MLRLLSSLACMGFLSLLLQAPLIAQVKELSVEVGGSAVRPPVGMEGEAAQFLVGGVRGLVYDRWGSGFMAAFQAGRSMKGGTGGDYFSGTLEGDYWHYSSSGWSWGIEAQGFGFNVVQPFPYRALGMEGGPGIRFANRNVSASLKGVLGTGWSRTELAPYENQSETVLEEKLWRVGATTELLVGSEKVMFGLGAGIHDSPGGRYGSLGGRMLLKGTGPVIELRVDSWTTPLGQQTTGGIALVLPLVGLSLRGFMGRTEPDPLTLAEPGSGAGGLMVGKRILGADPLPTPDAPLHEVLDSGEGQARIRIRVRAPQGTEQVKLLGDFTLWEPVTMARDGEEWVVEVEATEGVHHFGFITDGTWFVPQDAPDAVADEWGRRNATLVIER